MVPDGRVVRKTVDCNGFLGVYIVHDAFRNYVCGLTSMNSYLE